MVLPYLLFKKPGNKKNGIKQTCSLVSMYISATILSAFTLVITEPLRFISDSKPEGYLSSIEQVTDSLTVNQLMVLWDPCRRQRQIYFKFKRCEGTGKWTRPLQKKIALNFLLWTTTSVHGVERPCRDWFMERMVENFFWNYTEVGLSQELHHINDELSIHI